MATLYQRILPDPPMPEDRKILRLSSITTRLGELLLPATVPQFWVRAQFITDKSARTGHCYGTLVEVFTAARLGTGEAAGGHLAGRFPANREDAA